MWINSIFFRVEQDHKEIVSAVSIVFDLALKSGLLKITLLAMGHLKLEAGKYNVVFTQPMITEGHHIHTLDIDISAAQINNRLEAEFSIPGVDSWPR